MDKTLVWLLVSALALAFVLTLAATPLVRRLAQKLGAVDLPDEKRRIHTQPTPRMGGLAIFFGFLAATLLFADLTTQVRGILFGCLILVIAGVLDDIYCLKWWIKLLAQIAAAAAAILSGVLIQVVTNPNVFGETPHLALGWLSVPVTVLWIVGITNAVNLIDGLDGLAAGVSIISSVTMLAVTLFIPEAGNNVPVILAAFMGACLGFLPYNLNPAKIFMGDTGSMLLGYVLATVSAVALFKFYAIVTFAVPVLALAFPLADTIFAVIRRLIHGKSPVAADRGHLHHILLDMGLSQKQAVATLYAISSILGAMAMLMTRAGEIRLIFLVIAFILALVVFLTIKRKNKNRRS